MVYNLVSFLHQGMINH